MWEQALLEARPDRRIIVYQLRVVPFKQSISPLLLVNYESRACAKAFYNVRLDVYAVPGLSDYQIKILDKQNQWAWIPGIERAVDGRIHGYTDELVQRKFQRKRDRVKSAVDSWWQVRDEKFYIAQRIKEEECLGIDREEKEYTVCLEDHWTEYVEERLRRWGSESAAKAEESGLTKGALYISPRHDVFIEGYECGRHFHIDNASDIFGAKLEQRVACHHITATLDAATRDKVSTLVLVRPETVTETRHCVFATYRAFDYASQPLAHRHDADHDWRNKEFPSVESYFRLIPYSYNSPGFLKQLTEADGPELSQVLERWVYMGYCLDLKGPTEWHLVMAKSSLRRSSSPHHSTSADWTRDLMAHWGVEDYETFVITDCGGGGRATTSTEEQQFSEA